MTKKEIKALISAAGLKCWQVAEAWGLCDSNFSRKLRKPFSDEDVQRLKEIINDLTKEKENISC